MYVPRIKKIFDQLKSPLGVVVDSRNELALKLSNE